MSLCSLVLLEIQSLSVTASFQAERNDTILPSLCLWQSHCTNVEGQCGLGTSAILDKCVLHEENDSPVPVEQGLGRHAAHGRYSLPADAVQDVRFTAHVRLIC